VALPDLRPFFSTCATLERTGTPVLATIRLIADGGRWPLDAERLPWFDEALAVASWVDIEVESAVASDVVRLARARGRRVIVSHHDFTGTPDRATLEGLITRARALEGDVVKVATAVRSLEDHDRLLDVLRRNRKPASGSVALIGMGPLGTALRSYLPSAGSRFTYGYLDAVAAPGQIPARELVQRLLTDCPAYAEARSSRGAF
jgi:3-dehydroquinate dehydratase-1